MKFLTLEKEAFGLDISDRSLKVIKLKKRGKSFVLASFNQMDIEPGIIEKGVIQNEEALVNVIKILCKSVKGEKLITKYVVASLPEEKSFLQVIQMPKMKEEELKSAVGFEAENYIPLPVSEVYLDFQSIIPLKDHLDHQDVLIVATPKKIVNSYVSCLKKAGLIPLILEMESQAIARALVKNETSNKPVMLVDFGKTSTALVIFSGNSIHFTCSLTLSSEQLTQAISTSFNIDLPKAEKLKLAYTLSSKKPDQMLEAMNPILDELMVQIKKYLNFYQSHTSHDHLLTPEKIEKVVLCGGGANLKGLAEFLAEKLQIPVELGNFWTNILAKKTDRQTYKNSLFFVTALGLALRAILPKKNI